MLEQVQKLRTDVTGGKGHPDPALAAARLRLVADALGETEPWHALLYASAAVELAYEQPASWTGYLVVLRNARNEAPISHGQSDSGSVKNLLRAAAARARAAAEPATAQELRTPTSVTELLNRCARHLDPGNESSDRLIHTWNERLAEFDQAIARAEARSSA